MNEARKSLKHCTLCEWRCGIDRTAGVSAPCKLGTETFTFKRYVSYGDEVELVPAYRVYLSGCNFRCQFCNTAPTCFKPSVGEKIAAEPMAHELALRVREGVKTIDLLGGEPSLHVHTILEIAAAADAPLPLALDSNMYMTPEVLQWLDGVITLYIADFKFGNDDCAKQLAGVANYMEIVTRNLLFVDGRTPTIIRHLLMPGHIECCFKPVVEWIAANLPHTRFQLHTGYVPCWRANNDPNINRLNRADEVREAKDYIQQLNLKTEPEPAFGVPIGVAT